MKISVILIGTVSRRSVLEVRESCEDISYFTKFVVIRGPVKISVRLVSTEINCPRRYLFLMIAQIKGIQSIKEISNREVITKSISKIMGRGPFSYGLSVGPLSPHRLPLLAQLLRIPCK